MRVRLVGLVVLLVAGPLAPASAAARAYCGDHLATIVGTSHRDVLHGTAGRDVVFLGDGDDVFIDGGGGSDVICGGRGDDEIFAGRGADMVYGGRGDDRLHGGPGNDHLDGVSGIDRMFGEAGDDWIEYGDIAFDSDGEIHTLPSRGGDLVDGGPGFDLATRGDYASKTGVVIDNRAGTIKADHVTHRISGMESFYGTSAPDRFLGSARDETFRDPTLLVDSDVVLGRGGDDHLAARGTIRGGAGADTITLWEKGKAYGGPGRDRIRNAFYFRYVGVPMPPGVPDYPAGPFTLVGGRGADTMTAAGARKVPPSNPDGGSIVVHLDGGPGDDLITLARMDGATTLDLAAGTLAWPSGSGTVTSFHRARGSSQDDSIRGTDADDVLEGLAGDDVLIGGLGHDVADGGPGTDECQAEVRRACER